MFVSFEHRHLQELSPGTTRNFGVRASELAAIQRLDLSHNALRTLECPFAGLRGRDVPLRTTVIGGDGGASSPLRPSSANATLEEEGSGLRSLTSLAQLLVSHNQLRSLAGLCGAAHTLTTLVATHNTLTSLDGLQACRRLTYIDVSHNALASLRGLPITSTVFVLKGAASTNRFHGTGASVHFQLEENSEESAKDDGPASASSSSISLSSGEDHMPAAATHAEIVPTGVVLILAHNRLRSRALAELLWVGNDPGADGIGASLPQRRRDGQALLRPWCLALSHLDLSHNFIEDVVEVRRLLVMVTAPAGTSRHGHAAAGRVVVPLLARLRHLDVSDNPCLINGSLAEAMASSPSLSEGAAAPPLTFTVRFTSPALAEALRTSAALTGGLSSLGSLAAAQPAMEAALVSFAQVWRHTSLSPSAAAPSTFALCSPADLRAYAAAVRQHDGSHERLVVLNGAELTVLATAMRQRGTRLGDVLCVPASVPHDVSVVLPLQPSVALHRKSASLGLADQSTVLEVFLTSPPKWGRGMAAATTSGQSTVLSDAPADASHARLASNAVADAAAAAVTLPPSQLLPMRSASPDRATISSLNAAAPTPLRPWPHTRDTTKTESVLHDTSAAASSSAVSALGYRVYPGRVSSSRERPTASRCATPHPTMMGNADLSHATPVTPPRAAEASNSAAPPPGQPSLPSPSDDAAALQRYRAEASLLRQRYRELQRHTRDQAAVLQRHEAALLELQTALTAAHNGRAAAEAALQQARQEMQRLRDAGPHREGRHESRRSPRGPSV